MADGVDSDGGEGDRAAECMPCAGRGIVISRLGGQEHEVQCPWCEGSGRRTSGIDAQGKWLAEREAAAVDDGEGEGEGEPAA